MTNIVCTEQKEIMEKLQAPFESHDVEWRVQRSVSNGTKVVVNAYITNRAIMNRLDEVFGYGNWKNEFTHIGNMGVKCRISVKVGDEWVYKEDGVEFKVSSDNEKIDPIKTAYSNAMKRCGVQLGIGRYLYDLNDVIVPLQERGQNYHKSKYWNNPQLPAWALPKNSGNSSNNGNPNNQASNNGQNSSGNNGPNPKQEAFRIIREREELCGLSKDKDLAFRLFKKVNPETKALKYTGITGYASNDELKEYCKVLKPVSVLVEMGRKYGYSDEQIVATMARIKSEPTIKNLHNLFFNLTEVDINAFRDMAIANKQSA